MTRKENAARLSEVAARLQVEHVRFGAVNWDYENCRYAIISNRASGRHLSWQLEPDVGDDRWGTTFGIFDLDEGRWIR